MQTPETVHEIHYHLQYIYIQWCLGFRPPSYSNNSVFDQKIRAKNASKFEQNFGVRILGLGTENSRVESKRTPHSISRKLAEEQESSEVEDVKEDVSSAVVNDMCAKWGELQAFVKIYYPDTAIENRPVNIFNDNVMSHFRKIVQKRKKQLTMDRFLIKEKKKATSQPDSPP